MKRWLQDYTARKYEAEVTHRDQKPTSLPAHPSAFLRDPVPRPPPCLNKALMPELPV